MNWNIVASVIIWTYVAVILGRLAHGIYQRVRPPWQKARKRLVANLRAGILAGEITGLEALRIYWDKCPNWPRHHPDEWFRPILEADLEAMCRKNGWKFFKVDLDPLNPFDIHIKKPDENTEP